MNYEIIFYHAGKTAATEQLLQEFLDSRGGQHSGTAAATEPSDVPALLQTALTRSELIFIIGGLDGSRQSTDSLLSSALSAASGSVRSEKLLDDSGNTAYLLRCEHQTIVLLPDDVEVIRHMFERKLLSEFKSIYSLRTAENTKPSIEQVTRELEEQLSAMPRKTVGMVAPVSFSSQSRSKRLRLWAGIFAAASLLLLGLCVLFFLL